MRREKKERMRKNLLTVMNYFNMSKRDRENAILEEQKEKFFARGGRVKRIEVPSQIDFRIVDHSEAIDFLRA